MTTQRSLRWLPPHAKGSPNGHRAGPRQLASGWSWQALRWGRSSWVDIVWVAFVGLNLLAMRLLPEWQTIPFLAIWVSLTAIYGFRLWRFSPPSSLSPR